MARTPLTVRDAVVADAEELVQMWATLGSGVLSPSAQEEAERAVARVRESLTERLVVVEIDGRVAAAIHLRRSPMSPLHTQEVVHTSFLLVLPEHRRHGYARVLLDVAVTWAEELGLDYVTALTTSASREANRFMARLGLASTATLRIAPATLLRAKLSPAARNGATTPRQVLAQRRSLRRRQAIR
ncbi:MAG TPA: GNAT family N-acetyltransferase [Marmoricola sp.]|nr:GNAT family N-acetyltransferase [Marmoricola sp.]